MSLRFACDVTVDGPERESACLCAQCMLGWPGDDSLALDVSDMRVRLRRAAQESEKETGVLCGFCRGTGVEKGRDDDEVAMNLASERGRALLRVLGLDPAPYGVLSLPEARRALVRARNRRSLASFATGPTETFGAPRRGPDGAVELRPVRVFSPGTSEASLLEYVDRFAELVEAATRRRATRILWG